MTNILGDVTGIVDSTGTSVVEYNYDAWGKIISRHRYLGNYIRKMQGEEQSFMTVLHEG